MATASRPHYWRRFSGFGPIGGVFLVLALRSNFEPAKEATFEDLDKEQRAELQRLLANGQFGAAVGQVRLWFRGTSQGRAEEIVKQLA